MNLKNPFKIQTFLKTTSLVLALTILNSQLLYAADVRQMLVDAKAFFETIDDARRSGGSSVDELQSSEAQQQSAVDQEQALQDLEGLNFSLTTQNGDILKYVGDRLDQVQRPDGTTLTNLELDASGNIVDADLRLSDGSVQLFQNGKVIGYLTPDGTSVEYDAVSGKILKTTSASGTVSNYGYQYDASGNLFQTVITTGQTAAYYGAQGVLEKIQNQDGSQTIFSNGKLSKVVSSDGIEYIYNQEALPDGSERIFYDFPVADPETLAFQESQGAVSVEAESFHFKNSVQGKSWTLAGDMLEAGPDTGAIVNLSVESTSPRLDYKVHFSAAGTYYLWVRGFAADGSSDSLHAGIDGVQSSAAYKISGFAYGTASWAGKNMDNLAVKLVVDAPGEHTVNFWMREDGFKFDKFFLTQDASFIPQGQGPVQSQRRTALPAQSELSFKESDGQVIIEAENFHFNKSGPDHEWTLGAGGAGFSGNFVAAGPDTGANIGSNIQATSPRLDYKVHFQSAGTYYFWARGFATDDNNNSIHIGLDGLQQATNSRISGFAYGSASWTGSNLDGNRVTITVDAPGEHALNVWMREDGFKLDKIILTQDSSFVPSGFAAAESTRMSLATAASSALLDFPKEIVYSSGNKILSILTQDNVRILFTDGLPSKAIDAQGEETQFNFSQSSLGNLTRSEITQNGLSSKFSAGGKLSEVSLNGLTIHYLDNSNTIDFIEKTDGAELHDLVFDAGGAITGALVVTPDGEERTYEAGKLVHLRKPDLTQLFYFDSKPTRLITSQNVTYEFGYLPNKIEATLLAGALVPEASTPIRMEYDSAFSLKKVVRQNQEVLNYLESELQSIVPASGEAQVFSYVKDAAGKILSYTVTQGDLESFYDQNNQIQRALIHPGATNPHELDVQYQYGKIRQVKKDGALVFNYSYRFDDENREIVTVADLEEHSTKIYQAGLLVTSYNNDSSVLSTYSYGPGGKVSQVVVSRLERTLQTYDYSYGLDSSGNELTFVTDEEGAKRTYGPDKKLKFLEKSGEKFAYSYNIVTQPTEESTGSQETTLPATLWGTAARSVTSWGEAGWMEVDWEEISPGDWQPLEGLETYWPDQWVDYAINFSQNGSLKISLDALNVWAALPPGYTDFNLEFFIDGQSRGVYQVPASAQAYESAQFVLNDISQGSHTFRMKWLNDAGGPNGEDANFRFKNLVLKESIPVFGQIQKEIVTEELVEKTLSGGAVAHYQNGNIQSIQMPDGSLITDVVRDAAGNFQKAKIALPSGAQKVFDSSLLLEEINPDGTHFYFDAGKLSKAINSSGRQMQYSYEPDAQGNLSALWVKTGEANLRYDASGNLQGLKLQGVPTPEEIRQQIVHSYEGGGLGIASIDGDFNTAQFFSASGSANGGNGVGIYSTHEFPVPQGLSQIKFRLAATAYAHGNYIREYEASYYVQVKRSGVWETVSGSGQGTSGGDGDASIDSGLRTLGGLDLRDVTAIRAYAHGFGNASGGEGSSGGTASIYEIQFELVDQSYLTFNSAQNRFSGYLGDLGFDASGNFIPGSVDALNQAGQSLGGAMQTFVTTPYFDRLNAVVPAELGSWSVAAKEALPDLQSVVSQEYSSDGTLETQTKGDGTVTLFDENNKPTKVLSPEGTILIEYSYDASGHPSRVYLKNARDTLPEETLKARQNIESQKASVLKDLAAQRNLAYQSIQSQYDAQKGVLQSQLSSLESHYNGVSNLSVRGRQARNQRGDALNQISQSMDEVRAAMAGLSRQEADAYAGLDSQVAVLRDQIEADSKRALVELAAQEANLKKEILKEEVSPIVYDYYRRILGRDPSSQEYDSWVSKIDYDSGVLTPDGSTFFSGTWGYLSTGDSELWNFGAGDFTVETWVKFSDFNSLYPTFAGQYSDNGQVAWWLGYNTGPHEIEFDYSSNGSTQTGVKRSWNPSLNTWYHVAVARKGAELKFFVDGSELGATHNIGSAAIFNSSAPLSIGAYFDSPGAPSNDGYFHGRLDELRISKGLARYVAPFSPEKINYFLDAGTSFLLRSKTDGSFKDEASSTRQIFSFGSVVTDTAQSIQPEKITQPARVILSDVTQTSLYPGSSISFDGTGDWVNVGKTEEKMLGASDFTIDFWVKMNSVSADQGFISHGEGWNDKWQFYWTKDNQLRFSSIAGGQQILLAAAPWTPELGQWAHVALSRSGKDFRFFVNGVLVGTYTSAAVIAIPRPLWDLKVGSAVFTDWGPRYLNGLMDEVRLSIGVARWTADFTPQAETYLPDSYTKLLLRARSGKIVDESPLQAWLTVNGNSAPSADHKVKVKEAVRSVTTEEAGKAIENHINALPELAERQAYVQNVKTAVAQAVSNYLAMSEVEKESFAASLGLAPNELITLSPQDAQRIVLWLDSRSLHFGQSAFLSLEALLEGSSSPNSFVGDPAGRVELATRAILVDVLSGVISPLDDGDLVISVYALNKTAGLYGLALGGASLSWEDLRALYQASPNARVIAHINGNHYVIVTAIQSDRITYIDPGIGKDKENESVTITKDGFLKAWSAGGGSAFGGNGNVTLETSKLGLVSGWENKTLSASQTQKIRGAFWGSLLNLIGSILNIFAPGLGVPFQIAAFVVSIIEGDWTSAIASAINVAFSNLGNALAEAFKNSFQGLTQALGPAGQILNGIGQVVNGIGQAVSTIFQAVQGFFGGVSQGLSGFLQGSLGLSSQVAVRLAETAISTGVNFGISKGFEALGVSPQITSLVSSIATGAILGGFKGDTLLESGKTITQAQHIQSSIQEVITLNQIGSLGLELGLDPVFTNIVGLSLASIQGIGITNPGTSLEVAFSQVRPDIVQNLSLYGLERLGKALGLDARVTSAVSLPIAGALSDGLRLGNLTGQNIVQAVQGGLTQSIVRYGLDFIGTSHPILGSLLSPDVQRNIEIAIGKDGLFQGIFNILRNTALNAFNVIGDVIQTIAQGVTSFGTLVQQKGLLGALESTAANFFGRLTLESIVSQGGMGSILGLPQTSTTLPNGQAAKELKIDSKSSLYFDALGNLIGKKEDGVLEFGFFGQNAQGKTGLTQGQVIATFLDNLVLRGQVENGQFVDFKVENQNGELVLDGDPENLNSPLFIEGPAQDTPSSSFNFWGVVLKIVPFALSLFIGQGVAEAAEVRLAPISTTPSPGQVIDTVLMNGIQLALNIPQGSVPDYFRSGNPFLTGLNKLGIEDSRIKAIPLFEEFGDLIRVIELVKLKVEITNALIEVKRNQGSQPFVPLAYSGSGRGLLASLSDPVHQGFGVSSAILVGAPLLDVQDTVLNSASLERVINVYGSDDLFLSAFPENGAASIRTLFTNSQRSMETINIKLLDIHHTEYFYKNGENPTQEQINASNFLARLTQAALRSDTLTLFLNRFPLQPTIENYTDPLTGFTHTIRTYVIDTRNITGLVAINENLAGG